MSDSTVRNDGNTRHAASLPVFRASVHVMLKPSILDPQGRAVEATLRRLGHDNIDGLRVGKRIELVLRGEREHVEAQLDEIARSVLSNPVMEDVVVTIEEVVLSSE